MLPALKRHAVLLASLGAALALGAALGAWGMRWSFERTLGTWDPRQRLIEAWNLDLDLSPLQRGRVAAILGEEKEGMDERKVLWDRDARDAERGGEAAIASLLDARQRAVFDARREAFHEDLERYLWSGDSPDPLSAGPDRSGDTSAPDRRPRI